MRICSRSLKGFTLTEVLIVLTLMGITFSIMLLVFSRGVDSSLNISTHSEKLKLKVSLFWDLQRKVFGATRIRVEDGNLFMITTGGSFYQGVVKCAYLFRDNKLFYYEFPYPYGAIDEYEEDKLYELGRVDSFSIKVIEGNRELNTYDGIPDYLIVRIDEDEFLFKPLK